MVGLTLLHARFADRLAGGAMRAVLEGYQSRYGALVDAVTETTSFADDRLGDLPVIDLLTSPVYVLAEAWRGRPLAFHPGGLDLAAFGRERRPPSGARAPRARRRGSMLPWSGTSPHHGVECAPRSPGGARSLAAWSEHHTHRGRGPSRVGRRGKRAPSGVTTRPS